MITNEKLLKAGFIQEVINGVTIYTRERYSFIYNGIGWSPCAILSGEIGINRIYLNTMEELENFITKSK